MFFNRVIAYCESWRLIRSEKRLERQNQINNMLQKWLRSKDKEKVKILKNLH